MCVCVCVCWCVCVCVVCMVCQWWSRAGACQPILLSNCMRRNRSVYTIKMIEKFKEVSSRLGKILSLVMSGRGLFPPTTPPTENTREHTPHIRIEASLAGL